MIRGAKIEDAGHIADIIVEAWQTAYKGIIDPAHPKTMKREKFVGIMNDNIMNERERILVCEEDGTVKGFISGRVHERDGGPVAETIGLYVHPDFQGGGTGSVLLKEMKSFFRKQGCTVMTLRTLRGAGNNRFYQGRGGRERSCNDLEIGGRRYPGVEYVFTL